MDGWVNGGIHVVADIHGVFIFFYIYASNLQCIVWSPYIYITEINEKDETYSTKGIITELYSVFSHVSYDPSVQNSI